MSRKLSTGGNDSKAQGKVNWFDPIKGKVAAGGIQYRQSIDLGRGETHWLPRNLTLSMIRARKTKGYTPVPAHRNAGGIVWVPKG